MLEICFINIFWNVNNPFHIFTHSEVGTEDITHRYRGIIYTTILVMKIFDSSSKFLFDLLMFCFSRIQFHLTVLSNCS